MFNDIKKKIKKPKVIGTIIVIAIAALIIMRIRLSDVIAITAILISLLTLAYTSLKERNHKKESNKTKTTVLIQLSSLILVLENMLLEHDKWLEAEIRLFPDQSDKLKEILSNEKSGIEKFIGKLERIYNDMSDHSNDIDHLLLEELLNDTIILQRNCEAMRNKIRDLKEKSKKNDICSPFTK